jgi:ubiquinone/menaquinone biosynthesis C-methylase UbiE
MISDKYKEFIKNKNIPSCDKNLYISLLNKQNIYVNQTSNKQIYTFIQNIKKNRNIKLRLQFELLLRNFFLDEDADKILRILLKKRLKDTSVFNKVISKFKLKQWEQNIDCSDWESIIKKIIIEFKQNFNFNKIQYLDIGSGNGKKTNLYIKELFTNVNDKNFLINNVVHGTDIQQWGNYEQSKKYNQLYNFSINRNEELPYENNSFNVITVTLTLHHIEKLDKMLNEIKRVLQPNGVLIIIEHNQIGEIEHLIYDIQHMFYGFLYDKKNYVENPDFAHYYNMMEWKFIMSQKNFTNVKTEYITHGIENSLMYDNKFYSFYQNKK